MRTKEKCRFLMAEVILYLIKLGLLDDFTESIKETNEFGFWMGMLEAVKEVIEKIE